MELNVDLLPKKLNDINYFLKEEKGCSLYSFAEKNEERQNVIIVRLESFEIEKDFTIDNKAINMLRLLQPAEIKVTDNNFIIKSSKGKFSSKLINCDNFFKPNLEVLNEFDTNFEYLNKASAYVSKSDKKPILTGVRLDANGNIYATDSFRVYSKIVGDFSSNGITMPTAFIKTINDILNIEGRINNKYNNNNDIVEQDNITIVDRLLEGNYPSIEKIIKGVELASVVEINREEFVETLLLSQNVDSNDDVNGTIVVLTENKFETKGNEIYENNIKFENNNEYYLAVSQKSLLQALGTLKNDKFGFKVTHKEGAGQILFITNENDAEETILILGIKRQ